MDIFLNGKIQPVEENCTIAALIKKLNLENKRLAIEVNLEIVPRSQFEQQVLAAGDKVEIVQAIGGGNGF
jgi:thiamine biosynthesis protein ThiS